MNMFIIYVFTHPLHITEYNTTVIELFKMVGLLLSQRIVFPADKRTAIRDREPSSLTQ